VRPVIVKNLLILLILVCGNLCSADELINVTASVDKQTAYIGDLIEYRIVISYDSTIELTPPAAGANLGGFEVKDYDIGSPVATEEGGRRQEMEFKLRTFTTGDYVIPALPIEYTRPDDSVKYISADPIKITIKSLLAEGAEGDSLEPRGLKGQASLDRTSWLWWVVAGAAAIIIITAAIWYIVRRRRLAVEEPYVDPRPSWEIAFAELAVLKEKNLPGKGEIKRFYFELSEIFKKYLGNKFEFNAIDLTTYEIGEWLNEFDFEDDLRRRVVGFLNHADLVKFAKYVPPDDRPESDWTAAYELVTETKDMTASRIIVDEPEPVMAGVKDGSDDDEDRSELRFAPRELREMLSSEDKKEDES